MARAINKPAPSALESHTGYWLRLVSNHVSHAFKVKVEAHGVTVAEWVVMRALLETGGVNPSGLAERIGLSRGAVSKLIDRLSAKGYVKCRVEQSDRRFQTVALTGRGRALVPVLAALADRNDEEFFGDLDPRERAGLVATLRGIASRRRLKGAPVE